MAAKTTSLEGARLWLEVLTLSPKDLDDLRRWADLSRRTIPEEVKEVIAGLNLTVKGYLRQQREFHRKFQNLPSVKKTLLANLHRKFEMVIAAEALATQARMLERESKMAERAMRPELHALLWRAVSLVMGFDDDIHGKFQRMTEEVQAARRRIPLRDLAAATFKSPMTTGVAPRRRRKPKLKLVKRSEERRGTLDA
jgi:RNase H-fold protein (predicted Holliday junction resolvase)